MQFNGRKIWKVLAIPLVLLAFYLTLAVVWKAFHLPVDQELIDVITGYFDRYGLWIVFFGALLEGALIVGQYFPGGFIIFIGVVSAGHNIPRVLLVVLLVSIAFWIAYTIDYAVGKYGWYRLFLKFGLREVLENAQRKLARHHLYAILTSYWEPNLASITATAAGVLQLPLRTFVAYSLVGILIWSSFWGTFAYFVGQRVFALAGFKFVLIIFAVWIAILAGKYYVIDRRRV